MLLNKFDGGIVNYLASHLIPSNCALNSVNIDFTHGTLKPIKEDKIKTAQWEQGEKIISFQGSLIGFNQTDFIVNYKEKKLFKTDGQNIPKYSNDGQVWYNLGIKEPDNSLSYEVTESGDAIDPKYFNYAYTYYNSTEDIESRMSLLTEDIKITTQNAAIKLTGFIPSTDPQVDKIRLYKIGGNLLNFTLVTELEPDITEYTDIANNENEVADNFVIDDNNYGQAPEKLDHLTEFNNILFGIKEDKLYWTEQSNYFRWSPYFVMDFPENIVAIGKASNGLLVFTTNTLYLISVANEVTMDRYVLSNNISCEKHSIDYVLGYTFFVFNKNIYITNGNIPQRLNDNTLDFSVIYGTVVYKDTLYIMTDKGTYYLYQNKLGFIDSLYKSGTMQGKSLLFYHDGSIVEFASGASNRLAKYKSPVLSDGLMSMYKIYKDVYVAIQGEGILNVFIDGRFIKAFSITQNTELKIPHNLCRGYNIQFEYIGTGELIEIEYKAMQRVNGR